MIGATCQSRRDRERRHFFEYRMGPATSYTASGEDVSPVESRLLPAVKGSVTSSSSFCAIARIARPSSFEDHGDTPISIEFEATKDVAFGALMNTETRYSYWSVHRSTRIGIFDTPCCLEGTWYVVVRQRFDLESEVMECRSSVPHLKKESRPGRRQTAAGRRLRSIGCLTRRATSRADDLWFRRSQDSDIGIRFETDDGMLR